jgi:hypothetical protein
MCVFGYFISNFFELLLKLGDRYRLNLGFQHISQKEFQTTGTNPHDAITWFGIEGAKLGGHEILDFGDFFQSIIYDFKPTINSTIFRVSGNYFRAGGRAGLGRSDPTWSEIRVGGRSDFVCRPRPFPTDLPTGSGPQP